MCQACDQQFDSLFGNMYKDMARARRDSYFGDESPFKLKEIEALPFTAEELASSSLTQPLEGTVQMPKSAEEIFVGDYAYCEIEGDCADHGIHVERGTDGDFEYEIRWMRKADNAGSAGGS